MGAGCSSEKSVDTTRSPSPQKKCGNASETAFRSQRSQDKAPALPSTSSERHRPGGWSRIDNPLGAKTEATERPLQLALVDSVDELLGHCSTVCDSDGAGPAIETLSFPSEKETLGMFPPTPHQVEVAMLTTNVKQGTLPVLASGRVSHGDSSIWHGTAARAVMMRGVAPEFGDPMITNSESEGRPLPPHRPNSTDSRRTGPLPQAEKNVVDDKCHSNNNSQEAANAVAVWSAQKNCFEGQIRMSGARNPRPSIPSGSTALSVGVSGQNTRDTIPGTPAYNTRQLQNRRSSLEGTSVGTSMVPPPTDETMTDNGGEYLTSYERDREVGLETLRNFNLGVTEPL